MRRSTRPSICFAGRSATNKATGPPTTPACGSRRSWCRTLRSTTPRSYPTAPRQVEALADSNRGTDERRFTGQQPQKRGHLVGMRQHVVDGENAARTQHANRMRPPPRVLDTFRVEEEYIDGGVGEVSEIRSAVLLPKFDARGESRLSRVRAGQIPARIIIRRGVDAHALSAGVANRVGEP